MVVLDADYSSQEETDESGYGAEERVGELRVYREEAAAVTYADSAAEEDPTYLILRQGTSVYTDWEADDESRRNGEMVLGCVRANQ